MTQALLGIVDIVVRNGCVSCDTIVPQCDSSFLPTDSCLEVLALRNVLRPCQQKRLADVARVVRLTLNKSFKSASDSSCFRPMMRLVKPGLTKRAFWPVAG